MGYYINLLKINMLNIIMPWSKLKKQINKSISCSEIALKELSVIDFADIDDDIHYKRSVVFIDHGIKRTDAYVINNIDIKSPLIKRPTINMSHKEDIYTTIPELYKQNSWMSIIEDLGSGPYALVSVYNIHAIVNKFNPSVVYVNIPIVTDVILLDKLKLYEADLQRHNTRILVKYLYTSQCNKFEYEIYTTKCMALLSSQPFPDIMISTGDTKLNILINIYKLSSKPYICCLDIGINTGLDIIKDTKKGILSSRISIWRDLVKEEFGKIISLIPNMFIDQRSTNNIYIVKNEYDFETKTNIEFPCLITRMNDILHNYDTDNSDYTELVFIVIYTEFFKAITDRLQKKTTIFIGDKLNPSFNNFHCSWIMGHQLKLLNFDIARQLC